MYQIVRVFLTFVILEVFLLIPIEVWAEPEFIHEAEKISQILNAKPVHNINSRGMFRSEQTRAFKKVKRLRENKESGNVVSENIEVPLIENNVKMQIRFDTDSAKLRKESYPLLKELAFALNSPKLAGVKIILAGHTDNTGESKYNLNLSYQRARSVRTYLEKVHKVKTTKIYIEGYGDSSPLVKNINTNNMQLNRRVEISRK